MNNPFTTLFRSKPKPVNVAPAPASQIGGGWNFLLGQTTAGKLVTEQTAMQTSAVYACVRILSESIASLPLHLYQRSEDGGKQPKPSHPLFRLLHDEPNPEMTSFVFRETLMAHLLLWGNAYAQIIRDGRGQAVALYPLLPDRMAVARDPTGQITYTYQTDKREVKTMVLGLVEFSPLPQGVADGSDEKYLYIDETGTLDFESRPGEAYFGIGTACYVGNHQADFWEGNAMWKVNQFRSIVD